MDDMLRKSTAIVRGRALGSSVSLRSLPGHSGIIYTHYTVQILERWKGSTLSQVDVAVPGGVLQGRRQTFPGAPALELNTEYLLFLWTSPSGLTQIIGLSQGLMNVRVDASGRTVVSRNASSEPMMDGAGQPVTDPGFNMTLAEFRTAMGAFAAGASQ